MTRILLILLVLALLTGCAVWDATIQWGIDQLNKIPTEEPTPAPPPTEPETPAPTPDPPPVPEPEPEPEPAPPTASPKGPEYNAPAGYIEVPAEFIRAGIHELRVGTCSIANGQLKQLPGNPYRYSIPKPSHAAWDWIRGADHTDFGGKVKLRDGRWYSVYVRDWRNQYPMPIATRGPAYYYLEPGSWK